MNSVISLQICLFLLIGVGCLIRKIRLVDAQGQLALTDLVLYLILPCNIFYAFCNGADRNKLELYVTILLVSAGIQAFSFLYGRILFRRQPDGKRQCLQYGTICSNAGFIGNPIVEGLWGLEGLAMASVSLIPLRIMMWSSGLALFSGSKDRRTLVRKVLTHPCIIACELGIVVMLTGWKLPEFMLRPIHLIGQCNTALSMMVVGMILARMDFRTLLDRTALAFCAHRLVLIPGLCWLTLYLLRIEYSVTQIAVLLAAMPAGATTSILAEKYQKAPEFATKMVIISTLLSLPSVLIWCMLLG